MCHSRNGPHPCPRGEGNFFPQASETVAPLPAGTVSVTRDPQKLPAKLPASREFRRPVGGSCERVALIRKELRSKVRRFLPRAVEDEGPGRSLLQRSTRSAMRPVLDALQRRFGAKDNGRL